VAATNQSLSGRTMRWTFIDGPTAGKTYEHTFREDGTVVYHEVKEDGGGTKEGLNGVPYASFDVDRDVFIVSYLGESGFTLTVAINSANGKAYGFASNDKQWFPIQGTSEEQK
jgi:hypothetical protein